MHGKFCQTINLALDICNFAQKFGRSACVWLGKTQRSALRSKVIRAKIEFLEE
jgi:hypothetical protein